MRLLDRDYKILREINRWRYTLSRHIKVLADFTGQRVCDRRLKLLIEEGYIDRKKILYGVPSVYLLTNKGKRLIGVDVRQEKIRVERIHHDIAVIDTAIYFICNENILLSEITTEKQLYSKSGFGTRKHCPDFTFVKEDKENCVEIELSLKAKDRFRKIVESNYMDYENQYWVVSDRESKVYQVLQEFSEIYPNIAIMTIEEVKSHRNDSQVDNPHME